MQDFSNGQLSISYSRADGMHFIPAPELLVDTIDIQSDNIIEMNDSAKEVPVMNHKESLWEKN